jgi:hypothetical protein
MLQFSHETRVYVFRGKELNPPAPGSYDAAKWTPPTHQVFRVEIQGDGVWLIMLNGAQVACGEYAKPSRGLARELILTHCKSHLND